MSPTFAVPASRTATPMATAMARMAHTVDSRPKAMPDSTVVAGPGAGRLGDLADRSALGRGEVLGDLTGDEDEDHTGEHGVERLHVVQVETGHETRTEDGQGGRGPEAPVDGRHGRLVLGPGPHDVDADGRRNDADGRHDEREHHRSCRIGLERLPERREGGEAQDDGGDDGDDIGLEEVRRHAGAVTDVVPHVVGDGRRVAGVVLGDAGLDLAHEVGARRRPPW